MSKEIKTIICIFILFAISSIIFSITVIERQPYFGYLSSNGHQWLTGSAVKFLKNWYSEGAFNLKFAMFENPKSIEFPDTNSREIYLSYPPGTLIPVYIIAQILNMEPNADLVMGFNLANHFFIAFLLGLTCFIFLRKLKLSFIYSSIISIIPILIELLMPGPLYWHQNVFFSDQAIILPFTVLLFLEVLRDGVANKKYLITIDIIQKLLIFYGVLTDWLFIFIVLILYFKKIFNKEFGKNFKIFFKKTAFFFAPLLVALTLYFAQIIYYNNWSQVINKFLFRTSISETGKSYLETSLFYKFWFIWVKNQYGRIGTILIWSTILALFTFFIIIIYRFFKRKKNIDSIIIKITSISSIIVLPCLIQIHIFSNHTFIHSFSALKFCLSLSLLPLAILPGALLSFINNINNKFTFKHEKIIKIFNIFFVALLFLFSTYFVMQNYEITNPPPTKELKIYGEFINENSTYNDIFFSNEYEVPSNPPQKLSFSMKRVYIANSVYDIKSKISMFNNVKPNIAIFIPNTIEVNLSADIKEITSLAYFKIVKGNMAIYKIKYEDFIRIYEKYDYINTALQSKNFDDFLVFTKNLKNKEYIYLLYSQLLRREPDKEGFLNWLEQLDAGMEREEVLKNFLESLEYQNLIN